jgi:hypothetical protein
MSFGRKISFLLESCPGRDILTQEKDSMTDRTERLQRLFQLEAMITTLGIPDSA